MTKTFKTKTQCLQSGVTLIELLISITIGLVILIAIGLAYVNSTNIMRQRENQAELNEPSRIVMRLLQHDLSVAGYVDIFDSLDTTSSTPQASALFVPGNDSLLNLYRRAPEAAQLGTPFTQFFPGLTPIFGCDGAMNSTPYAISTSAAAPVLACGSANATSNTLQIAYQAAPGSTATAATSLQSPDARGEGRDCNQQSLTAPVGTPPAREAKFAINRYFVRANTSDGINELYCSGSGNAIEQPMVRGIEEFVIRYQTALPGTTATLTAAGSAQSQYASAATVTASALGWANVTAVEICIVSATAVTSGAAAAGTATLQASRPTCARAADGNFAANVTRVAGDARLWKRFTSVVTVRNAIYSTPY
jgi:type IV pilus assembly protein PilW